MRKTALWLWLGAGAWAQNALTPATEAEREDRLLRPAELVEALVPQPGWLAAPATVYRAEARNGILELSAEGTGRGMKWSVDLPEPLDLTPYRYVTVRYRARGTAGWGDYLLWLSGPSGDSVQPVRLDMVRATGRWITLTVPLNSSFQATQMALQVSSREDRGQVWLDTIRFSTRKPLLPVEEALEFSPGWEAARLSRRDFRTVDLHAVVNAEGHQVAHRLDLRSWFPPGELTAEGIPFRVLDRVAAAPEDIHQKLQIPVGEKGREMYVLLAAQLPPHDLTGMLGAMPLERLSEPERFVFEVVYEDGLTDQVFPVNLAAGQYEVAAGLQVCGLTGLRPVRVRTLALRNGMESGRFYVAAVTLNQGPPLLQEPPVPALPPPVPRRPEPPVRAEVCPFPGGYEIDNGLLKLRLRTAGGIELVGLENHCLRGIPMHLTPGPLFEIGNGKELRTSAEVAVGAPRVERQGNLVRLVVPVDGQPVGVPLRGELIVTAGHGSDLGLSLDLVQVGSQPLTPVVNFPVLHEMVLGTPEETWYLWARKGGIISNQQAELVGAYGGEYPLQIADVFSPRAGGGLALQTYDRRGIYRYWHLLKNARGVTWRLDYWPREYPPGERLEIAPTALRAHTGDWRTALDLYRRWAHSWYRPQVPRKPWFQRVFYYQQVFAWSQLWDPQTRTWKMAEVLQRYHDFFGRLDYLHLFDFGESRVYGRVGDYTHYDELGGLELMQRSLRAAQEQGVKVGLYIEGYLCDIRGQWGREGVPKYGMRRQDGRLMEYTPGSTEYMMCVASDGWRRHLADTYHRVAGELHPNGMYIDQFGFVDAWKTCWSREHGHPVPWPPIRGERDTLRAIRRAVPPEIATLTEETPHDVNSQYQDGALGYSVAFNDPNLAPHRVDLFRFVFPSFKVFQLVAYNPFVEGGWHKLKFPFFNGEGYWLHHQPQDYCEGAHQFLKKAFAILHEYEDCFCSEDVEPLVPTLSPTLYANRFRSARRTVWTLFNAGYRTFRGPALQAPYRQGMRCVEAFTGQELPVQVQGGLATLSVELGPREVGCVVVGPE